MEIVHGRVDAMAVYPCVVNVDPGLVEHQNQHPAKEEALVAFSN
jgi:hypothetical protein